MKALGVVVASLVLISVSCSEKAAQAPDPPRELATQNASASSKGSPPIGGVATATSTGAASTGEGFGGPAPPIIGAPAGDGGVSGSTGGKPRIFQAVASELEGKIAEEDLSKALDDSAAKLSACISVDTTATVRLKVQPSGKVTEANVSRTVPNDSKVRDCLASALRGVSFPRLKGTEPAAFGLDLMLKKQS
ncbi:MAG: hypothetical protein HOW73_49230 [Polyangiaceae bacterium]|nr:hypothetical protein [Polyangiaceae bacterium]